MVWARTKLMIHDDLLRPIPLMTIKFEGPHPEKFYREIPDLIESIFRISEHSIQEKKFEWTKGDPQKFNVKWEAAKDLDKFSYYWIEVKLSGSSSKGQGKATISIEGALRTEYPQETILQRSLPYEFMRMLWHSSFYAPTRDKYMKTGRRLMSNFISRLKEITRI